MVLARWRDNDHKAYGTEKPSKLVLNINSRAASVAAVRA
jgi:hypothetical protein